MVIWCVFFGCHVLTISKFEGLCGLYIGMLTESGWRGGNELVGC